MARDSEGQQTAHEQTKAMAPHGTTSTILDNEVPGSKMKGKKGVGEASKQDVLDDLNDLDDDEDFCNDEYGQELEHDDNNTRIRKPYTITRARKSWTAEEHNCFLGALARYGRNWKNIQTAIDSKTVIQIRSHAQKYFLKVEKKGTGEHVPPPRMKRKASRPYPKNQGSSKPPYTTCKDKGAAQVSLANRALDVSETGTSSRDWTSYSQPGPSGSSSLLVAESLGSTSTNKSAHPPHLHADMATHSPAGRGKAKPASAIHHSFTTGKSEALATTSSGTKRPSSSVGFEDDKCLTNKAARLVSLRLNAPPCAHIRSAKGKYGKPATNKSAFGSSGDSSNKEDISNERQARAGYAAGGSTSMTMNEPASSSANPSFLPNASPSTHSGSVPGSGCGGMTTSKCGDQAAAVQTTNSDDAKPSDGSADGRKGSGDSGGQNSNSTGKSEAANDTATTVRACRGAGNPTSEKYAAHRASPDNSSGDTDHGSGGGSNDDNDEASPAREEQGQQGSNMKPSCFRAHPKASQHSRAFECGPSSSGDGDEGGGGGGSSESKHEPDHQRSQKRFAPQHSNVQSGYQYELSGGCKEARGPSSASENDASTGSDGTNDQQQQSQTLPPLQAHQSDNWHGRNQCDESHMRSRKTNLDRTGKLQSVEAGAPTSYDPLTSTLQQRSQVQNTNPCSNAQREGLERMENKGEMDSGSADDDSLGGLTGLSLAFSNEMLMDEDVDPIGAGTESRETLPFAQAVSANMNQGEVSAYTTPLWTRSSHNHYPIHVPHNLEHSQPQQTQSLNSQTCPRQTLPVCNPDMRMHQQPPAWESSFQSMFDEQARLQEQGMLGSFAGWMNTNNASAYEAGPSSVEQNAGDTASDANYIEVYKMLAAHLDPTGEDEKLQQEIGQLYPMEQRSFDGLMGNLCRALMSQEGQDPPVFSQDMSHHGDVLGQNAVPFQQQSAWGQLPISFTLAQSQVADGGMPLQSSMPGESDDSFDPGLKVTFDMHSTTQWQ